MSHMWLSGAAALTLSLGLSAQIVTTQIEPTNADDGPAMYASYCASCHGASGKGTGPAAAFLKIPATDLTKLAAKNGGDFPSIHFLAVLSHASGPHGTGEMPVWSDVFKAAGQGDHIVQVRLFNIMKHVQDLQDPPLVVKKHERKAAPARVTTVSASSGGDMFRAYCASCHGMDGRGAGPAAWTLKKPAADLSGLARQNGGKFPEAKVRSVLTQGKDSSVHGTEEMPVWGTVFANTGESESMRKLRIHNLTTYIEGLQR